MAVPFVRWVFAKHMENGREVFWKMGKGRRRGGWRFVGVADDGSSAGRCGQASWGMAPFFKILVLDFLAAALI